MRNKLFVVVILVVLNLSIFGVFEKSFLYGLLLLLQSLFVILISESGFLGENRKLLITSGVLALIIFIFLSVSFLRLDGMTSVLRPTYLDMDTVAARKEFYAEELGVIYRNRFGILFFDKVRFSLTKFTQNAFSYLDFNLYFNYKNLLSFISLVLFVVGIYNISSRGVKKFLVMYFIFIFLLGGLLNSGSNYGVFIYLPLLNLMVVKGMFSTWDTIAKYKMFYESNKK